MEKIRVNIAENVDLLLTKDEIEKLIKKLETVDGHSKVQVTKKEAPAQKNTKISYIYRDASNYKIWEYVVLKGTLNPKEHQAFIDLINKDDTFFPEHFGLNAPTFVGLGYAPYDDDPKYHELMGIEAVEQPATSEMTIQEFVALWKKEHGTKNTLITYVYEDIYGHRLYASEVLLGAFESTAHQEFADAVSKDPKFFPKHFGMKCPVFDPGFYKFMGVDPDFHRVVYISSVTMDNTIDMTVEDFYELWKMEHGNG